MTEAFGMVPEHLLPAALVALDEGRLDWRVTDQHGRSCNGGKADPLPVGEWSPCIADPEHCVRGWHTTSDPLRWRGCRVWLVECEAPLCRDGDKRVSGRIRPLAEVDPLRTLCARLFARAAADLSEADLSEANLSWANLSWADLSWANLSWADLSWANLSWANLRGALTEGAIGLPKEQSND